MSALMRYMHYHFWDNEPTSYSIEFSKGKNKQPNAIENSLIPNSNVEKREFISKYFEELLKRLKHLRFSHELKELY